ncbi:hypothetical protein [Peribacillus kribbensis]|uniref:hypothetical protein n=1 Tax=Peribacillus kribbensis TaxID=356658 RepID=UPI00041533B0|nr:hypothetical protein [Peribacillus kribbensis]
MKWLVGKPDFIETIQKPESSYYIYGNDEQHYDVEFRLVTGKVKRYLIASDKYEAAQGIS